MLRHRNIQRKFIFDRHLRVLTVPSRLGSSGKHRPHASLRIQQANAARRPQPRNRPGDADRREGQEDWAPTGLPGLLTIQCIPFRPASLPAATRPCLVWLLLYRVATEAIIADSMSTVVHRGTVELLSYRFRRIGTSRGVPNPTSLLGTGSAHRTRLDTVLLMHVLPPRRRMFLLHW